MKKKRIFISYSWKDASIADAICRIMPSDETEVFIDRSGIHGSEDFVDRLAKEINRADMLLFIASRNSCSSKYVKKELLYAMEKGIPVLPFIVDNAPLPDSVAFLLGDINQLSLKDHPIDVNLGREILLAAGQVNSGSKKRIGKSVRRVKYIWPVIIACVIAVVLFVFFRMAMEKRQIPSGDADMSGMISLTLANALNAFRQVDSLMALGTPELTGEQEISILTSLASKLDWLDSLANASEPVFVLPDSVYAVRNEIQHSLDSMDGVWLQQARISLSLYEKTHIGQELSFARKYLDLAGKIKKDSKWERLYEKL